MRTPSLLVLSLALTAAVAHAQDKPDNPPATAPSTAPAGEVIDATEIEKLKAAAGKTVTARGKVSGVFIARSGRILINFEGANRDFVGMITKENADAVQAGFNGDLTAAIEGKSITMTGEVALFRDNPQIEVKTPDQIKVVEEGKK